MAAGDAGTNLLGGDPIEFGSHGLRFPCPKAFDGDEKKFDEFNTKLKSYLNLANPNFRGHMLSAQGEENPLDYNAFTPECSSSIV